LNLFNRFSGVWRPKSGAELAERFDQIEKEGLEKNDYFAMVIGGFIAFWPILAAVLIAAGLLLLLFR